MLGTDVIVAVTAGLRMGRCDSAWRWHAEYFELANTLRGQLVATTRIARGQQLSQQAPVGTPDWGLAMLW
jgi:hypothetical protein